MMTEKDGVLSGSTATRWSWRAGRRPTMDPWPAGSPMKLRYHMRYASQPRPWVDSSLATRLLNVCVATAGIVLTAPLMVVIALVVKASSPGPVIFRQPRVGVNRRSHRVPSSVVCCRREDRGGRIFTIYKFRTMRVDSDVREVWASRQDTRVTGVGGFLRATRLDEIPQFFNVLKGDMNIVGPRPEQPGIFVRLRDELAEYRRRQGVLPGITGLAQIELGYDTDVGTVRKKVELDLEYIRRRSAVHDLAIMLRTIPVVVCRKVWM
jgi:lipopolysaccharide/colanic/teichoic acid biosynthesis glycosyltransferase